MSHEFPLPSSARTVPRYSTREIVQDAVGSVVPVHHGNKLGWNPSWVKAADFDTLLTARADHAQAVQTLAAELRGKCSFTVPPCKDHRTADRCERCAIADRLDALAGTAPERTP